MCGLYTEVITQVREKKCQENVQVLVLALKKTDTKEFAQHPDIFVSEVRKAANSVCDLLGSF